MAQFNTHKHVVHKISAKIKPIEQDYLSLFAIRYLVLSKAYKHIVFSMVKENFQTNWFLDEVKYM